MRLLVGIATAGRWELLNETLTELGRQCRPPDAVIVCSPLGESGDSLNDGFLGSLPFPTTSVSGPRGTCSQRNTILRHAVDFDAIIFLDDDFFPEKTYIANAEVLLGRHPAIVLATGHLVEDGIHGPGLSPDHARRTLATLSVPHLEDCAMIPYYGAYGCNMVIRLAPVLRHGLSFDETLPLYGWQEDIDFSRQLAPYGSIVRSDALTGVHLGAKRFRISGVKFGYSQVANPIYLIRKGTMSVRFGLRTMLRNLLANSAGLFCSDPHIDRIGRCKGNILALTDFLRGRLHPQRIIELE